MSMEEFVISENESCSHVIRPDWPTREKDVMCSMQAGTPVCVIERTEFRR